MASKLQVKRLKIKETFMSKHRTSHLLCLTAACLCGCGRSPVTPPQQTEKTSITQVYNLPGAPHAPVPSRLTARIAVARAMKALGSPAWQIAFLSNTGVSQQVTSDATDSGLMHPDGTAGQWIVEAFENSPKPYRENGRTEKRYPFRVVDVSGSGADLLPASDDRIVVPTVLSLLKPQYIDWLDEARRLAITQMRTKFDVLSASSDVRSDGSCKWRFRFYDLKQQKMVCKVCVSGDGARVLVW